jgi:hypothetical protein
VNIFKQYAQRISKLLGCDVVVTEFNDCISFCVKSNMDWEIPLDTFKKSLPKIELGKLLPANAGQTFSIYKDDLPAAYKQRISAVSELTNALVDLTMITHVSILDNSENDELGNRTPQYVFWNEQRMTGFELYLNDSEGEHFDLKIWRSSDHSKEMHIKASVTIDDFMSI